MVKSPLPYVFLMPSRDAVHVPVLSWGRLLFLASVIQMWHPFTSRSSTFFLLVPRAVPQCQPFSSASDSWKFPVEWGNSVLILLTCWEETSKAVLLRPQRLTEYIRALFDPTTGVLVLWGHMLNTKSTQLWWIQRKAGWHCTRYTFLLFNCSSWLLNPDHEPHLHMSSSIVDICRYFPSPSPQSKTPFKFPCKSVMQTDMGMGYNLNLQRGWIHVSALRWDSCCIYRNP